MDARRIPFLDAHVHLWDLDAITYPWLTPPFADDGPNGSVEPIANTYLLDDYLADAAGWNVVGLVHVDAGADVAHALDETRWLQAMAAQRGMPNAIIAFAALDDPTVDALLEAHAAHPDVRGIRHIVNWHADPKRSYTAHDVTIDPAWERGFTRLANLGLSFDLQCYPGQMAGLAALFARHADVPVAINHLGMPVLADGDGLDRWRAGMAALAALPQVVIKASGLGFVDRVWTLDRVRPLLRETIDLFGTDRVLFASDFPTDKLFADYDRCLAALDVVSAEYSDDERRAMFAENAARFYRIEMPGAAA